MLAGTDAIEVIGEASGARDRVRMALDLMPDVVIMDISMPDLNGILATKQILTKAPAIRVVIFSAESGPKIAAQALSSGASAYLVKSSNAGELIQTLHLVMEGGRYVSPSIQESAQQQERPRRSREAQTANHESHWPIRVVLVDDTQFVRERLAELLSALEGVQVVGQASDVAGALQLIQDLQPDVLVLDIELPGQSGMDLLAAIPKDTKRPLIIVLTDYDYPVLRHGCAKLGADFYFYKPIEFERVIEVCEDLAKRALKRARPAPEE
jgi:DNA-binding NarL/FixJ family response regulator